MKKAFALVVLLLCVGTGPLRADEIQFWLNRFGGIFVETAPGKEQVRVFQGNKETEKTLFKAGLTRRAPDTYRTRGGTVFTLKHLDQPIINDANRRLNSGDWQLTISGQGRELRRLKPKLPFVAFGDLPPLTFLGEKADQTAADPRS